MTDSYGGTPSAASYYERLGINPDAGDSEINRASKLAKRSVHPDNNSSEQTAAEREFDRVTDAADALTDNDGRATYDTFIDDQGPEIGTARYEEWDAAGRPKSPTAWLSEPRSSESSSTASTTSTANASTTSTSTADNTASRARANANRRPNNQRQPGAGTQRSSATREDDERTDDDSRTTTSTTDTAATARTAERAAASETASTTPTGRPHSKRAPESVLGEDPEELYSKYVLDSETEWGPDSPKTTQSASGRRTPSTSISAVGAVVAEVARSWIVAGVGGLVTAVGSWWIRVGGGLTLLAIAAVVGPIAESIVLLPFVFLPRIGPWLYPTVAVAVTVAPKAVPLDTSAVLCVVYAGLAGGYALLDRRRRAAG